MLSGDKDFINNSADQYVRDSTLLLLSLKNTGGRLDIVIEDWISVLEYIESGAWSVYVCVF